ncbi:MAG: glycosyltransferase family 39 protein [Acidobacteriia bacterium]|nr:glycosyltransferase family 39 protein [Terriglobia bacterium]
MKPTRIYSLLVLLYVAIVVLDCIWFALDDRPPIWDMAVHLTTALDFWETFKHASFSWATLKSLVLLGKYYPTLFPALMGVFFWMFHPSVYVGPAANFIPLAFLIAATYGMGRKLFSEQVGMLAAFLVATYPVMAWLTREALLDLTLVAVVATATWAYLSTENFSSRKGSWLYGVTIALGFLAKHGFIFYALPLAIFALYEMVTRDEAPLRRRSFRFRNFLTAHLVGIAGAALWYAPHWSDVREYFFINRQLHYVLQQPEFMTAPSLLFTLDALTRVHMLFVPSLFLLLGVLISLRRFPGRALILFLGGFGSLAIMTFALVHREVRMSVASLPYLAVLTAGGLCGMKSSVWRRALTAVLVVSASIEFGLITFGVNAWPDAVRIYSSPAVQVNLYAQSYEHLIGPPHREDWKIIPILNRARDDASQQGIEDPQLGIVPDLPRFNHFDFIFYSRLQALPVQIQRIAQFAQLDHFAGLNYLLIKSGSQGEPGTTRGNAELNRYVESDPFRFQKVGAFDLPDGSEASLYRQKLSSTALE